MRFHLRKLGSDQTAIEQLLKGVKPEFLNRIVLHDHYSLAFHYELGGIHLPEAVRRSLSPFAFLGWLHKLQAQDMTLSTSVHEEDILSVIDNRFHYVFYSPVFSSISKPGYQPKEDMDVSKIRIQPQIIGLGGVKAGNIHHLPKMGYQGAAVLGAIWHKAENAVTYFKQIQQICKKNGLMY